MKVKLENYALSHSFWYVILAENRKGWGVMERPVRKVNRLCEYDYSTNGAYFITICTQDRKKILSKIVVGTPVPGCPTPPLLELLWHGRIADKYIQQMHAFYDHISIDKYAIMPDHIHLLITLHEPGGHPRTGVPTSKLQTASFRDFGKKGCGLILCLETEIPRNSRSFRGLELLARFELATVLPRN